MHELSQVSHSIFQTLNLHTHESTDMSLISSFEEDRVWSTHQIQPRERIFHSEANVVLKDNVAFGDYHNRTTSCI